MCRNLQTQRFGLKKCIENDHIKMCQVLTLLGINHFSQDRLTASTSNLGQCGEQRREAVKSFLMSPSKYMDRCNTQRVLTLGTLKYLCSSAKRELSVFVITEFVFER